MEPKFGPIGKVVYERTYKRPEDRGWRDTVRRTVKGNLSFAPHPEGEKALLEDLFENFYALPAGRHLWASGVKGSDFVCNCWVSGFSDVDVAHHFVFTFMRLMEGGGVGANYSANVRSRAPLPRRHNVTLTFDDEPDSFLVSDSREGWSEALEQVLIHRGGNLSMNLSSIRPAGAPLRRFGGVASGSKPLVKMLRDINRLCNTAGHRTLTAMESMTIDHYISECVIAGNVRRSARMSILNADDPEIEDFLACKQGETSHWSTNISVGYTKDTDYNLLRRVLNKALENGEPGLFNLDLANENEPRKVWTTNPCGEVPMEAGESCNLGHINLAMCPPERLEEAFRAMTRFLIRATFVGAHDPLSRNIIDQKRRIGVGIFGLHEYLIKQGLKYSDAAHNPAFKADLRRWKSWVDDEATTYSKALGVPRPVKTTCVAPTGTIAKLAGVSEGIQPIFAKQYLRRVQFSRTDPNVPTDVPVEDSVYSPDTVVASYLVTDPLVERTDPEMVHLIQGSDEVSVQQYLWLQACVQRFYADNAISITVPVLSEMGEKIKDQIIVGFLPVLKGLTLFPEKNRPQQPYERIEECESGACPVR